MSATDWLKTISRLSVYRAKGGPAPHKPLLLLVAFELAERGLLPMGILPLTPDLAFRFNTYFSVVAHRRTQLPDVRFPFYHLRRENFWAPLSKDSSPATDPMHAVAVQPNADFVDFAMDAGCRATARRLLISQYFEPSERAALYALIGLAPPDTASCDPARAEELEECRGKGREARFRLDVVAAYNYACALTGLRITTTAVGNIVDAAHIHQFSRSRNNDARNGIALCKNAHWLFDNGLWTLDDDYRVLVAVGCFSEDSPDQRRLVDYTGEQIRLPADRRLWPEARHLAWHRQHRFQVA